MRLINKILFGLSSFFLILILIFSSIYLKKRQGKIISPPPSQTSENGLAKLISKLIPLEKPEEIKKTNCQKEFIITPLGDKKSFTCGLIEESDKQLKFLARYKGAEINNDGLVQVKADLISSSGQSFEQDLVLGKKDIGITWITVRKEDQFYQTNDNQQHFQKKVDENLIQTLNKFKNGFFVFRVLKNNNEALQTNPGQAEEEYREDILFRQKYFNECTLILEKTTSLEEIEKECGFVFINDLTFFSNNLEL